LGSHNKKLSKMCYFNFNNKKIHEYKKVKVNQVTGKMGLTTLVARSNARLLNATSMLSHS
jgi:hypothetical protein